MTPPISASGDLMRRIRLGIAGDGSPAAPDGCPEPFRPWRWGGTTGFGRGGEGLPLLTSGWSQPGSDHVWSDGRRAVLTLPPPPGPGELLLDFQVIPFCCPAVATQGVRVSCGGRLAAVSSLCRAGPFTVLVSRPDPAAGGVRLEWEFPDARSPSEVGAGADPGIRAIALRSLTAICLGA